MPRYVIVLDTPGIKSFVFGTDALAEVRGASALLDRLNREDTTAELQKALGDRVKTVFANGGTGQFVVTAERADVDAALKHLSRYCREESGGEVRIVWGIAEFATDADYKPAVENAQTQMRNKRETAFGVPATTLMPLFRECSSASHLPVDFDSFPYSTAVQCKRDESVDVRHKHPQERGPWAKWMKHLDLLSLSRDLRPTDGVEIARIRERRKQKTARKGYVGLIYADGNAMGRLLQELDSVETCHEFSKIVDESIHAACFEALKVVCGPEIASAEWAAGKNEKPQKLPADILLLGGDDLLVLLPADLALTFALHVMAEFERQTRERIAALPAGKPREFFDRTLGTRGMTVSCGVALAPAKYPFYLLRHLAEELRDNAKKSGSADEDCVNYWAPSYLDFHLVAGAATPDLKIVRKEDYQVGAEKNRPRTLRPYRFEMLQKLRDAVTRLQLERLPRSKLLDLFDAALEPRPAVARRRVRELFARLREKREEPERLKHQRRERQALRLALDEISTITDFPWRADGRTALADLVEAFDLFPPE